MRVFIDAPLLIYLNTLTDPALRAPYESLYLRVLSEYKPYTDVLVLDELIYVSRRKYNVPYEVSAEFVKTSVLPYVRVLSVGEDEFEQALKTLLEYNLKPSDALHVGVMLSNGITLVVSEDKEFDKVPGIDRLWLD